MSFTRTLRVVGGAVVAGALLFGTAPVASADQVRKDQWPLTVFGVDDIWKVSTGKGVTVAVIDDPVDGSHPDLKGSVLPGKSFLPGGGTADHPNQEYEHGTAMASLIAGHGHGPAGSDGVKGLAPDAKILPVGIYLGNSSGVKKSYAEPLRYAVDHGAKVVNMSFEVYEDTSPAEKAAVEYARKHDVLVVAASGNSGSSIPRNPSAVPGILAVGAMDIDLKVWKFSNYGSHIRLLAPGVHIRSAGVEDPYRLANGTSDATAYVSATAALLRQKFPDLTAGQIANRLVKTAILPDSMKGKKLPDPHYGYGIVNPWQALIKKMPAGSENGPLPALKDGSSKASGNGKGAQQATESDKGMSTGVIIGIVGGVVGLLVVVLIVVLVVKKKSGRNGPPPGGPGGFGGPGGSGGFVPQPPNPGYQQQPSAPGVYPSAPPTQPPGQ
ncbi:S8 family serine peptidase [Streptomyces lydicamycinicus]|uniref:Putative M8 family peptidase n=1 Tax=Streptomyces lydicamycinicus TaxID=1546107 RepID=A0A0P4R2L8_9ACTN|nr:S8 family serine peptidase [Streptomyces lydicamycinicus]USA01050.1 S8 family serine peptidase [Streptomyces lydicamycinicus]GAO06741.1 putative M8 family peptidase [Streptomyces lydicamycinicus]